jgi:uncharacterized protein GlcG (DUF336 family)
MYRPDRGQTAGPEIGAKDPSQGEIVMNCTGLILQRTVLTFTIAIVLAFILPASAAAQLASKPVLTLEASRQIATAAEAHARANGWNVVITIVDDGGHPVLLQRLDDTQTASVEIALAKARSAAAFRRPTRVIGEWVASGNTAILGLPGAVPLEGGVPLVVDGQVVGAIGVSGVTAEQDGQIAQAGADALAGMARRASVR